MKFSFLKKIRVALTLVFFVFTSVIFLNFTDLLHPGFFSAVTFLQFIPSAVKFFSFFELAAIGFVVVIALTLLFGRVYCSTICPLGAIQDITWYFIKKFRKKKFYYYTNEKPWLRFSILAVSAAAAFSGFIILINLLDPFSNSGKILVNLIRPVIIYGNNLISYGLQSAGVYSFYAHELKGTDYTKLIYPTIFFASIFLLVYKNGRLFCNLICPVGSFLGLISKVSFVKISINERNCRSCKLCERVCKGGCIDKSNKVIDFSRCVGCYNCFTVCPSEGIVFTNSGKKHSVVKPAVDIRKRKFVSKSLTAVLALAGLNYSQIKITPKKKSTIPVNRKYPSTPPGSFSIEHFNEKCTACHLCVSACPSQVLQPSLIEYGLAGMFQPVMDFRYGGCNYECKQCLEICPSGAITSLDIEKKKLVQIGKAKFIKENCIVYTENTACGACSEHCPTKAVDMIPYKNIHIPEVTPEYCTGCGACEHACPTQPYKSIYVEGNPIHLSAKKRVVEKIEQKVEEDFPF